MTDRREVCSFPNVVQRTLSDGGGQDLVYYMCVMPSDVAKTLTFVPVFEKSKNPILEEVTGTGPDEGYQRPGSRYRMKNFATYVEENPLSFVPPVVLSTRDNWKFESPDTGGTFGTLRCFGPAAIVDGQHRVGGHVHLYEADQVIRQIELAVVPGLTIEAEKKLFMDINDNAKNVVAGLRAILGGSDDVLVGRALLEEHDSPFRGRIKIAVLRPGQLFTMNAVEKNVGRTFSHGAFDKVSLDDKVDIMKDYWTRIADAFALEWEDIDKRASEKEYKLLETTGLIAFSLAAEDILGPNYDPMTRVMNWPQVEDNLNRLADSGQFDLRKDGHFEGLTGEVGGARIHRRIQNVLAASNDREDSHYEDLADE